ncbi:MAG TPA: metal ABC transporter ATP-binding protein [Thermomicrobiales bacterium]|nr:metal ABC transporter ATP-binding protein [Thermomicrobiales bacterium]
MPDTALLTQPSTPIVQTHDLSVHYEDRSALRCVNIPIYPGETMGLLGPNGAGKSTLLKVIAGMLPPSHGHVTFRGEEITGSTPCITYVPQRSDADWTFPISVLEATMLGLAPSRSRWKPFSRQDRERTMHALEQVGMDHLAKAQIGALSGGQQQRVFLARALLACGEVLLLDEPFTGVDVPTQEMLVGLFDNLRQQGTAIVYATHDLQQAARTSDRVVLLNGEVIASGPPSRAMDHDSLHRTFGGQVIVLRSPEASHMPEAVAR